MKGPEDLQNVDLIEPTTEASEQNENIELVDAEKAAVDEKGFLSKIAERVGEKGRALALGFSLMTAAIAGVSVEDAEARHNSPKAVPVETEKSPQPEKNLVENTWQKLLHTEDKEVANAAIRGLAARLKVGVTTEPTSVILTRNDVRKVAEMLNGSVESACKISLGGESDCTIEQINDFNLKLIRSGPGQALMELLQ